MTNLWLKKYISESEIRAVSTQVREAERGTTGEIVPMIVKSSSKLGSLPLLLTLLLTCFMFILDVPLEAHFENFHGLGWLWPIVILLFYGVSLWLARWLWVQRLLSFKSDLDHNVHVRSQLEFFLNRVDKTQKATAILIFISLMEHKAVVLADRGIASKVPVEAWEEAIQLVIDGLKRKDFAGGLGQAIHSCGQLLKKHFPQTGSDSNELSNELIVKE